MIDRSRIFVVLLISLILYQTPALFAQLYIPLSDSLQNEFQVDFYKRLTTWEWLGRLRLASQPGSSWNWFVREQFQSNLLIPAQGSKKWKDDHDLKGTFFRRRGNLDYGLYTSSWFQSDKQGSADNQFGNQILGMFGTYRNDPVIRFTPYAGYQQSKNRNLIDWGWDAGFKGEINQYKIGDYQSTAKLESNFDLYDQRKNFDHTFKIALQTRFNEYSSDSLTFSYGEISKEYWGSGLERNNLVKVKIFTRELNNRLDYNLSPRSLLNLTTKIQSRSLDFMTSRNIFFIENQFRFLHIADRFNYGINLRTNDETQDNTGISTDSRTRQTALNFQMGWRRNPDDVFYLDLAYVKLQYDTPDEKNMDDRDEQRFIFNARYLHRFSPFLSMDWNAYAYLYHQIYIHSQMSQNNSWNRVFKLNPQVHYHYDRLRNILSTEVLANYSVYDFEELFPQTRSFVFRKYSFADSLIYRLIGENHIGFFTRIELEDKGSFFEKQFAQQVVQSYHSSFLNLFIENRNIFDFELCFGYSMYTRREWRHIPIKKLSREISNTGPYINLRYRTTAKLLFAATATLSKLSDSNTRTSTYVTSNLQLYYTL